MLQTYAKAKRKEINQIITIYQPILEFSFEELGLDVTIKPSKEDVDNLIDDVNSKLIEVCDEYLGENKIGLDKYQLSMIVMDLYTRTIAQLSQPFYVQARESKNKLKEYVKANKEYIEKAKKVKMENKELQEEALRLEKKNKELQDKVKEPLEITTTTTNITVNNREIPITKIKDKESKKIKYNRNPDILATEFTF